MSENDQPYSNSWEKYSLEDLRGSEYSKDGFATFEEAFEHMPKKQVTDIERKTSVFVTDAESQIPPSGRRDLS